MNKKSRKREPRVLFWDIETTNLNATFGTILCIGYKWLGARKARLINILDGPGRSMIDDAWVVREFAQVFNQADYHVTWYGSRFDLPMVRSKLLALGDPPLLPVYHVDLWAAVRYRFKLHSNRLVVWEKFLELPVQKTPIDTRAWLRAAVGDRQAMAEVAQHCTKDVLVLEAVYQRLRPWLAEEPARHLFVPTPVEACPSCGSFRRESRGWRATRSRRYRRYSCLECGKTWRSSSGEGVPLRVEG